MSQDRLAGQIAWISGAASGMAAATARLFAAEGARVAIADIQADRGKQVESQIREQGGEALFLQCDISSESDIANGSGLC